MLKMAGGKRRSACYALSVLLHFVGACRYLPASSFPPIIHMGELVQLWHVQLSTFYNIRQGTAIYETFE